MISLKNIILFNTIITFLKEEKYRDLLLTTGIIIAIGTVIYHYLEGWSWIDSFYFCVVTLTTIGYGDFSPQTNMGKLFTIVYILTSIGIILSFVNAVYLHYTTMRGFENHEKKSDS